MMLFVSVMPGSLIKPARNLETAMHRCFGLRADRSGNAGGEPRLIFYITLFIIKFMTKKVMFDS